MAQLEILAHHRTAQVEIAVLHAQLVTAIGIVFDGEWWGSALADDIEFTDDNLDVARRQLRILGITLGNGADTLPLLASILYYPGPYDSEDAHRKADLFSDVPQNVLAAIAYNFTAFNNFLMTKTEYSILTEFTSQRAREISTDAADALYDLSSDGLGDAQHVERLNLLTYLRILRKKTIESVRRLSAAGEDPGKIANTTGLDITTITKIL